MPTFQTEPHFDKSCQLFAEMLDEHSIKSPLVSKLSAALRKLSWYPTMSADALKLADAYQAAMDKIAPEGMGQLPRFGEKRQKAWRDLDMVRRNLHHFAALIVGEGGAERPPYEVWDVYSGRFRYLRTVRNDAEVAERPAAVSAKKVVPIDEARAMLAEVNRAARAKRRKRKG